MNKLLEEIHELEVLDREIKRNNDILTKRNKQLQNSNLEMRGMYVLLKRRNLRYMKDNPRLYRMIRLLRLQLKNSRSNPSSRFTLETLTEATVSLYNPEAIPEAADFPNIEKAKEIPEYQPQN